MTCKVDAAGLCTVSFDLPKAIARGEGSLAFAIEDGGVVETAAKTIPILLQTLDIAMFPEGGELVGGVKNRLYVEARTPSKKPADLEGEIFDVKNGAVVAYLRMLTLELTGQTYNTSEQRRALRQLLPDRFEGALAGSRTARRN